MKTRRGTTTHDTQYGVIDKGFRRSKLREVCVRPDGIQTGPFGSQLHQSDYVTVGTPIITVEHLGENRILKTNLPRVKDEDKERLCRYHLKKGDIVFSRVGSVDRRALVRAEEDGWMFSGRCLRVRPNPEIIDPEYLSWFFGLPSFQEHIRQIAVGATMPSLNTSLLSEVEVFYPKSLAEQKRIAHILGTLDDKIEVNRRMNETLEGIAQAIFKSWFVDFDPVIDNAIKARKPIPDALAKRAARRRELLSRAKKDAATPGRAAGRATASATNVTAREAARVASGIPAGLPPDLAALFPSEFQDSSLGPIPKGWRVGPLDSMILLQRGFDLPTPKRTPGKYPVLAASGPSGTHNEFMVRGPGITTGRSGVLGNVFYVHDDFWPLNTSLWVKEFRHSTPAYVFYYLQGLDFGLFNAGSAVPTLNRNHVHKLPSLLPPMEIIKAFEQSAILTLQYQERNVSYSGTLATLRDMLLQKLLSGEININGPIKFVEART